MLDSAHVFRDDGHSGAVWARPGLDRLRDAVKGRELDRVVLVTTPDRLARNYVHQMVLLEEWAQAGCAAEFLDRPMSDDPHDHLLLQIRGAVAEYERTLIAERMRRGRLAKLRAGLLLPWTYAPYGYRMHPDRPRDPRGVTTDPAEAAVVAELFAMYLEPGASLMQLALHLDARGVPTPSGMSRWSSPTIRGILRNPTYTGQVYAQRTRYRAPTHRRSATHLIGRSHGTAVPQPADTWILLGRSRPLAVSRPPRGRHGHLDPFGTWHRHPRGRAGRRRRMAADRAQPRPGRAGPAGSANGRRRRSRYRQCWPACRGSSRDTIAASPGALGSRGSLQAATDLAQAQPFQPDPGEDQPDRDRLLGNHLEAGHAAALILGDVAVTERRGGERAEQARARCMAAPAAAALQDPGALVLGDNTLDLQQQVVLRRAADRTVEEDDLGAGTPELLHQQHLMGLAAGQPVGGMDVETVDAAGRHGVTQPLQSRAP